MKHSKANSGLDLVLEDDVERVPRDVPSPIFENVIHAQGDEIYIYVHRYISVKIKYIMNKVFRFLRE